MHEILQQVVIMGPTLAPPALGGTRMVKEQCFVVMVSLRFTHLQKTASSGNTVSPTPTC